MKMTFKNTFLLVSILSVFSSVIAQTAISYKPIKSPDGNLVFQLSTDEEGILNYSVLRDSVSVIAPSQLGIEINGQNIAENTVVGKPGIFTEVQKFGVYGSYLEVNSKGNHAEFLVHSDSLTFEFHVKVFDKGVGFRYVIPNTEKDTLTLTKEFTAFNFKENINVYSAENYESIWKKELLGAVSSNGFHAFPVVAESKAGYVLLTEAMHHDYGALALKANAENGFDTHFINREYYDKEYTYTSTITSPWRVIMINKTLNGLVNNSTVYELADKPKATLGETSWIKRGASAWSWIFSGFKGQTFEKSKELVDGASAMGWPYATVDDGWEHWDNKWEQVKKLCDYAKSKDVKIILWKPTSDYQPEWQKKKFGDLKMIKGLLDTDYRAEFFKKAQEAGVSGLKIDFVGEENLQRINIYKTLLEETFQHKMVVNFHGSNMPTGFDRAFPNEVTREAIGGMEYVWNEKRPKAYRFNTFYPFTRYVIGSADYTPMLGSYKESAGSRAHQLASVITINSPFSVMGIDPNKLKEMPEADLMTSIPTSWEETVVLSLSKVGEIAALAKRSGKVWYVGVVNGTEKQEITINLSEFLKAGTYKALIYKDKGAIDAYEVEKINKEISDQEKIQLTLQAGQGYAMRLIKK